MPQNGWIYIAPHRIRKAPLNFPFSGQWEQVEEINMQRLARVFEFQGCIAFVGSGASIPLHYPSWEDLIDAAFIQKVKEEKGIDLGTAFVDPTQTADCGASSGRRRYRRQEYSL
jgi:hypothetical protein